MSDQTTTPPVFSLNRIHIREKPVIDGTIKAVVHALIAPTLHKYHDDSAHVKLKIATLHTVSIVLSI